MPNQSHLPQEIEIYDRCGDSRHGYEIDCEESRNGGCDEGFSIDDAATWNARAVRCEGQQFSMRMPFELWSDEG
jgi:hypothetical protein